MITWGPPGIQNSLSILKSLLQYIYQLSFCCRNINILMGAGDSHVSVFSAYHICLTSGMKNRIKFRDVRRNTTSMWLNYLAWGHYYHFLKHFLPIDFVLPQPPLAFFSTRSSCTQRVPLTECFRGCLLPHLTSLLFVCVSSQPVSFHKPETLIFGVYCALQDVANTQEVRDTKFLQQTLI